MDEIVFDWDRFSEADMSLYDNSFLRQTIQVRQSATNCKSTSDYYLLLQSDEQERLLLAESLKNSYSSFFRSASVFSLLEDYLVPQLVRQKLGGTHREIRVWSAGCAAGQEAYSVAMILDYHRFLSKQDYSFRIFATDYSPRILEVARHGRYDRQSMDNVKLKYLDRYFEGLGSKFTVKPELSQYIQFSYFDLLDTASIAPPDSLFGEFDLVMCCNVLFYYSPESRLLILHKLVRSLADGGYLITGEAEAEMVENSGLFVRVGSHSPVFRKR